jgi:hypothetical protein
MVLRERKPILINCSLDTVETTVDKRKKINIT